MDAMIVLHGLFLLTCNQAGQTCDILIANTPPHLYKVGAGINLVSIASNKTLTTSLPVSSGKTPFTPDFADRELMLDSSKISVVRDAAMTVISVPMPDEFVAANRVAVLAATVLNGADPSILKTHPKAGSIVINETTILHYRAVSGSFSLLDGASPVQNSTAVSSHQVMVFYSWPPDCNTIGNHTMHFNAMLQLKAGGNPNLVLSGILSHLPVADEGPISTYLLPDSIMKPPCLQTTQLMTSTTPATGGLLKFGDRPAQVGIFTVDTTGCGQVFLNP